MSGVTVSMMDGQHKLHFPQQRLMLGVGDSRDSCQLLHGKEKSYKATNHIADIKQETRWGGGHRGPAGRALPIMDNPGESKKDVFFLQIYI
jgi:hypothetical protein